MNLILDDVISVFIILCVHKNRKSIGLINSKTDVEEPQTCYFCYPYESPNSITCDSQSKAGTTPVIWTG